MAQSKEEMIANEQGAYPCKTCKRKKIISYPNVFNVNGLFYARCPNCNKYDLYDFLGTTKKAAIRNWNEIMIHDYDSTKKKENDE